MTPVTVLKITKEHVNGGTLTTRVYEDGSRTSTWTRDKETRDG